MGVSKRALRENNYKLKKSLKKCGFDRWRYFFNGVNAANSEERSFFIEISIVNPAVSYDAVVSCAAAEKKIESQNLQEALTGNLYVEPVTSSVVPSYCCIRSGILGRRPRQLVSYFPCEEFNPQKKFFNIEVADCVFSDDALYGIQTVTRDDCRNFPQSKSDVGRMEWNLKYTRLFDSATTSSKDNFSWFASGINTEFSGTVSFDGVEYMVSPEDCFGYADKFWGVEMPAPFLHISSSRLVSIFTGSLMKNSSFALEADFDRKCVAVAKFNNEEYSFGKRKKIKKFESNWSCVKAPSTSGEEELHWSVSLNSKKYILDVDIFSKASELIVKDYEMPKGGGLLLKVLGGGSATGEIRLYRQIKKTLELIQHAKIATALAEYGVGDTFKD